MTFRPWVLPPGYFAQLVGLGGASLALALAVLLAPRGAVTLPRVVAAAVWVAGLAMAALVLLFGANPFASVMVAWIELALVVPLVGVSVGIARLAGRRIERGPAVVAVLGVSLLLPAAQASLVEPFDLRVERPSLALDPLRAGEGVVRVGILADLQTTRPGPYEREAVERLLAEDPHVILIPGDLFHGTPADYGRARPELRALLEKLRAPGGAWFVSGNCDVRNDLVALLDGTGVELLVNRPVEVAVGDRRLIVLGLDDAGFPREVLRRFEERARSDPEAIHVVLAHRPDAVLALSPGSPIDVVIAGHTHGGQVVIPGFGPPLTLSGVPREIAAGGLSEVDGNRIYVSRGVGLERLWAPRIRFFCPPEVSILTLR